jgi:hypothetical protein
VIYSVILKSKQSVSAEADKFNCESGNIVFYKRYSDKEPFAEVKRIPSNTVKAIEEK